MKTLKVLTLALLINSSLFSQSLFHIDANKKRLMLNIELINNEGNEYNGIFITSDNEKTIFYNTNSSSFYSMNNKDIYKIKLNQKHSFGKSFGTNIIYSGIAATIATIPIFATGDAIMIGPEFFIGFFTTVGGVPISLLSSRLGRNINHAKIDYIVDENNAINLLQPIFQKNNNSKFLKDDTKIINIPSNINDSVLKTIAKPSSYYHPLHENKVHFSAGLSTLYCNIGSQVKSGLKEYDFNQDVHNSSYDFSNSISLNLKLSYLVKNNIRVYAMYNSTNEFANVYGKTNTEEIVMITNEIYTFSTGAEYVFKPVNRLFVKKYEFSVNAGLAINDYSNNMIWFRKKHIVEGHSIYDYGIEESMYYKIPSIEFGGNLNYYISRNLSFKASIIGNVMLPKRMQNFEYTSVTNETVSTGDYCINLFSITPTFGIDISF